MAAIRSPLQDVIARIDKAKRQPPLIPTAVGYLNTKMGGDDESVTLCAQNGINELCSLQLSKLDEEKPHFFDKCWALLDIYIENQKACNLIGARLTKYIEVNIHQKEFAKILNVFNRDLANRGISSEKMRLLGQYACFTYREFMHVPKPSDQCKINWDLFNRNFVFNFPSPIIVNWLFKAYLESESEEAKTTHPKGTYLEQLRLLKQFATGSNKEIGDLASQTLNLLTYKDSGNYNDIRNLVCIFYIAARSLLVMPTCQSAKVKLLQEWSMEKINNISGETGKLLVKKLAVWYLKLIPLAAEKQNPDPATFLLLCGINIRDFGMLIRFKQALKLTLKVDDNWIESNCRWLREDSSLKTEINNFNARFANPNEKDRFYGSPVEETKHERKHVNSFDRLLLFLFNVLKEDKLGNASILKDMFTLINEYHVQFKSIDDSPVTQHTSEKYESACKKTFEILTQMAHDELESYSEKKEYENSGVQQFLDCIVKMDANADKEDAYYEFVEKMNKINGGFAICADILLKRRTAGPGPG